MNQEELKTAFKKFVLEMVPKGGTVNSQTLHYNFMSIPEPVIASIIRQLPEFEEIDAEWTPMMPVSYANFKRR